MIDRFPEDNGSATRLQVGHRRRPAHFVLGVFLASLFLVVEGLVFISYQQATKTSRELSTATDTVTTLSNLQRESLLLQTLALRTQGPKTVDQIALRRQLLERQLVILEANTDTGDLQPRLGRFLEGLRRFDQGLSQLQEDPDATAVEARRVLIPPLMDLQLLAKQLYDANEHGLYGAIYRDLRQAEKGQVLLGSLSGLVLVLALVLVFFLRRSIRSDFARAHRALLKEARERETLQKQLSHQAFHDPLTGLANRALFIRDIERCLARIRRSGGSSAVIYLDLDNFKTVNDTLGHVAGDELLKQVALRLQGCIRSTDMAARLGGDEFAVLLENGGEAGDVTGVVERIMTALRLPFQLEGQVVTATASVGVLPDVDPKMTTEDLIRSADIAMYDAKSEGKGVYVIFDETMRIKTGRRVSLERELHRAIRDNEFVCFYQPIVDLKHAQIRGVEALVRWQHPSGEIHPPSHFLQTAEQTGLINKIGEQVLLQAATTMAGWHQERPEARSLFVSVNVSSQQIDDPLFAQRIASSLEETGLDPNNLIVEITESLMMKETDLASRVLGELRDLGVRIAVDDFGIGYSSLSYLRFLPIDILKIDRSFISGIPDDQAIAATIVSLAKTLGMVSLAEGIEREQQWRGLEKMGCALGQGFLIAKPEPADAAWRRIEASLAPSSISV